MAEREPERPTKALPSRAIPPLFERPKEEPVSGLPNGVKQESPEPLAGNKPSSPLATEAPVITNKSQSHLAVETSAQPPSSPSVHTRDLPELEGDAQEAGVDEDAAYPEQSKQLLTAIYRPESKTEWREKLRSANETAERASLVCSCHRALLMISVAMSGHETLDLRVSCHTLRSTPRMKRSKGTRLDHRRHGLRNSLSEATLMSYDRSLLPVDRRSHW
jgi:hypothetical protein